MTPAGYVTLRESLRQATRQATRQVMRGMTTTVVMPGGFRYLLNVMAT